MILRNGLRILFFSLFILLFSHSPSNADTSVGGRVSVDTIWTLAGSPYIVTGTVQVYGTTSAPVTLTIEPGVTVKFNNNTGLTIANGTSSPGALKAVGTASSPIVFTSNDPSPAPGKWYGITFNSGTVAANSVLDYVTVEYGGGNGNGNLYLNYGSPTITNSTIRKSLKTGIYASYSSAVIQNNTIVDNATYGHYDNTSTGTVISGNTFSGNGSYPVHIGINQTGSANTCGTNGVNAIEVVGGTVSQNLTMKNSGIPYVITSSVSVYSSSGPTLTIEPGVTVKFSNTTGLTIANGTSSPGALKAVGTASSPIVFTSNDPSPAPGKWKGVTFNSGTVAANSVLDYVTVEYGGGNGNGNLYLSSASPTITNSTIQKSSTSGINAYSSTSAIKFNTIANNGTRGIYSYGPSNAVIIQNNTIANNTTYGHYDDSGAGTVISGNTFSGNGSYPLHVGISQTGSANTYGTNGINAIEVAGGTVTQSLTMKNNGIPYVITSSINVYSSSGPTLTIESGVTVKINNNTGLTIANGSSNPGALKAVGTASSPIVFTSNDPSPAPGKWYGITFNSGTVAANSVLDYVTVEYGGGNGQGNLYLNYGSPTITNSAIQKSSTSGICAYSSASVIKYNTIANNGTSGVYSYGSSNPQVNNNNIFNNTQFGARKDSSLPRMNVTNNWWGDPSGPYHSTNPSGLGNKVSDYVDFSPWLDGSYGSDTTPPTVSIDPVTSPTYTASQTITGTMELKATITVGVDTSAIVGPVSYPTPTSWSCTITELAPGNNTITATARDVAGNAASVTATIWLDAITISSVTASRNVINTAASEYTTIFFTLNRAATATLKIIPEKQGPTGAPVYQVSQSCAAAGSYLFTWDGHDGSGNIVPDEAYLYVIEASEGVMSAQYCPAPPRTASITCSDGSTFDPYKNIPLDINYTVPQPSRVKVDVLNSLQKLIPLLNGAPRYTGTYTYNWDGRDGNNYIQKSGKSSCSATPLAENVIITTGMTPVISAVKADPYVVNLSYGQFTNISYTLSTNSTAMVTVKITSPSNTVYTLAPEQQSSGQYTIKWPNLPTDTGNMFPFKEEGDYMITIQAVASGYSSTAKGTLHVQY